jgi:hypothetical protein
MGTLRAGVAVVDITPPAGLLLAGFAARSEPATGVHDALTARAVVVGDTAVVVADVIGIHEEMSARIRERCPLPAANVIVAATHTHGAPISMAGRLSAAADPAFLQAIEDGCVEALTRAAASAAPVQITAGMGADPDVARNRRHEGGITDPALPVLRMRNAAGDLIAVIVSYALHPTVLGADNRLITGDFPHFVRAAIEAAHPGAVAVFLNGCAGDVTIGHTAHGSVSLAADTSRTFENAQRVSERIAKAALAAPELPIGDSVSASEQLVELALERREQDLPQLAADWERAALMAEPAHQKLFRYWANWARTNADTAPGNWTGRISLLDWGGVPIVALPGEILAETGLGIRAACGDRPAFVLCFADGTPGYIPPASEYGSGGYEVDEAHRFYGMPGSFAPGSAERLVVAAQSLLGPPNQR